MKLDDRITIIHGMNGYGKTTILKMVNALFNRRYSALRATPFKEFRVDLEDGGTLAVTKLNSENKGIFSKGEGKRRRHRGIHIKLLRRGKEIEKADLANPTPEDWEAHQHF